MNKSIRKIQLFLTLLIFIFFITACSNSRSASYNITNSINVRDEFYDKSVEVMNFYIKKLDSRALYTDEDNDYLLDYYRSTPSNSDEEIKIKTSLTNLDLIYRTFENNIKNDNEDVINMNIDEFQSQLEEVKKLLNIIE